MRKLTLSIFVLSFLGSLSAHASPTCKDLFFAKDVPSVGSRSDSKSIVIPTSEPKFEILEDFQRVLSLRIQSGTTGVKPRFVDPREEIEVSKTWQGEELPGLLKQLSPDGITAIDHSLFEANAEGVVKTAAGGTFVPARAALRFNGIETGVNFGAHAFAWVDNAERLAKGEPKSLVRKDAKAVVLFIHGGGTKTTGHHVAIQMHNVLAQWGIDVVSIDLPWHAEGDRHSGTVNDPMAHDIALIRSFAEKYLKPAGKDIYLGGHSWGGFISDEYMMRYPKAKETIFKGLMPLSGVPDLVPGGTPYEKLMAELEKEKLDAVDERIDPEERSMTRDLFMKNKISPVAGAYIEAAMRKQKWTVPNHRGDEYLPTLIVMGSIDPLYLNVADTWQKYRANLSNIDWVLLPQVGHLIFDVMEPESTNQWTYMLMKDFIAKTSDVKLEKDPPGKQAGSDKPLLASLVVEWFNRPVFREFVRNTTMYQKTVTPEFYEQKKHVDSLRTYLQRIDAIEKDRKKSPEDKRFLLSNMEPFFDPILKGNIDVDDAKRIRERLYLIQSGKYVPPVEEGGARAAAILKEIELVNAEVSELGHKKDHLKYLIYGPAKQPKKPGDSVDEILMTTYTHKQKELSELVKKSTHSELVSMWDRAQTLLNEVMELNTVSRERLYKYYDEIEAQGRADQAGFMASFPSSILRDFELIQDRSMEYQAYMKHVAEVEKAMALSGQLGSEVQTVANEIFGQNGLEERVQKAVHELAVLERQVARFTHRYQELRNIYVKDYSQGLFTIEEYSALRLFQVSPENWIDNKGLFERLKASWNSYWRERQPEARMSYY